MSGSTGPYLVHEGRGLELADVLRELRLSGAWRGHLRWLRRRMAIAGLARRRGLSIGDAELQSAVDTFRKSRGLHKVRETESWLAHQGATLDDLEAHVEIGLLERALRSAIQEGRVAEFFAAHRADFDSARLRVFEVPGRDVASELLEQFREGEQDFPAIARAHSVHRTREAGGDLGWCRRTAFPAVLADPLFAAGAGEAVGPVPGRGGFRAYLVEERRPAALDAAVANEIRSHLLDEDLQAHLVDHPVEEHVPWTRQVQ